MHVPTVTDDADDGEVQAMILDISSLLDEVAHRWYEIGVLLGVPIHQLTRTFSAMASQQEKLQEMVKCWLDSRGGGPRRTSSWSQLVGAVEHQAGGENRSLAISIARLHPASGQTVAKCSVFHCL